MKKIIVGTMAILVFFINVCATDVLDEQSKIVGVKELVEAAPEDVGIDINSNTSLDEGIKGLWQRIKKDAGAIFTRSLSCIGVVITVSVLGAVVNSMQGSVLKISNYVDAISAVAIVAAASGSINTVIGMSETAIEEMCDFSNVLFPTLAASVAASGSPAGAVIRHSASVLFSSTCVSIMSTVLIPLVGMYIASATANAAIENSPIGKICSFIEWVITGSLKLMLTLFLAYISISGFVASTSDMVGVKTLTAISGAVPVVGGILSNATGAVMSGAKVLKNSVGVFGLISVASICLTPCLVLGVNYFLFKVVSAVLSPVCEAKCSELVGKIGTSFGIMLGITASCAMLLFIAIVSCMFAVGIT
ncbi:MAG: stage III sporulation protein AE [Clostridia bacterium]|nr:stage III sporulation protein AE [Clostridia bacterium]